MVEPIPLRPRRPCPICGKTSQRATHPFCSSRCAQVDLNRWLGGQYAIPATEVEAEETGSQDRETDPD